MGQVKIPIKDYSNETSTVSVYTDDAVLDADITSLFNAVDGVSIGTLVKSTLVIRADKDTGSTALPADSAAQRELKWSVAYTDNVTGKSYRHEIPCADTSLLAGNTDQMDVTAGAGLTYKTQFESTARSELDNAVTLNAVTLVGRS